MAVKKPKKKTSTKSKKKTAKKIIRKAAPKKKAKEEVIRIKSLPRSTIVDEDLRRMEMKHGGVSLISHGRELPSFYKKYVLRCTKCVSDFEHRAHIPSVRQAIQCPECGEIHIMEISPVSGEFRIQFSEGLEKAPGKTKKSKKKR